MRPLAFLSRLTLALVLGALASVTPVHAEDGPGSKPASGDDLSDLLSLDETLATNAGPAPAAQAAQGIPPEVKAEIDRQAAALRADADAMERELYDELPTQLETDPAAADAEIVRRMAEADGRLNNLEAKIDQLSEAMANGSSPASQPGARVNGPRGYGDPIRVGEAPRAGRSPLPDHRGRGPRRGQDPRGEEQFAWWQKLVLAMMDGIQGGLEQLAEKRANALKGEADALALGTDPRYRGYADAAVRRELGDSNLALRAGMGGDPRLNDLFLAPSSSPSAGPVVAGPSALAPSRIDDPSLFAGPSTPVTLLPRVRDPVTGRERIVIDYPLGETGRPIR